MKGPPAVIDTNVLIAGLLTTDPASPTTRILDAMVRGRLPFLLSHDLIAEYSEVLRRPKLRALHGLADAQIEALLTDIVANGMLRAPVALGSGGPDPGDRHLWELAATGDGCVVVTGDEALRAAPPAGLVARSPRAFVEARPEAL